MDKLLVPVFFVTFFSQDSQEELRTICYGSQQLCDLLSHCETDLVLQSVETITEPFFSDWKALTQTPTNLELGNHVRSHDATQESSTTGTP